MKSHYNGLICHFSSGTSSKSVSKHKVSGRIFLCLLGSRDKGGHTNTQFTESSVCIVVYKALKNTQFEDFFPSCCLLRYIICI